ncbi:ribosomal RNA-processing protein 7 homolog A-like isoform X2 [Hydractinia symbiolongicarpus]|uniref:ribosomal RNA-processing protein 7 homolog A-like isoform X2 n=1 Tax=Hydractinia symbiolongicarpus TaxID=13093 RepID=UPI00254B3249|nr:ribosomal RNA-processing protein 7 homolog A-like isoform X2 [Hydractinia symbiolongicarpus]
MARMHSIQCSFNDLSDEPHTLFMKRHSAKNTEGSNRTLFVVNVPSYCDEDGLRNIFSDCGFITAVHILDQPGEINVFLNRTNVLRYIVKKVNTFKVAYVVFKHENSIDTALEMSSSVVRYISTKENPVVTGIDKWINEYEKKYPAEDVIQDDIDEYMKKFDEQQFKELMNFYLFQQRESKRDKIADLRQKFEEDKKRITQMRQQRNFKPF